MLRIRNLDAGYGKLRVLKGVSLHVQAGEIVTIIGANGAGKTTLLHAVAGLQRPWNGEVAFDGGRIDRLRAEKIVFRGCSLVPEGRQLFAAMTVRENLLLGGFVHHKRGEGEKIRANLERIHALFPRLRERQDQLAGTLSGGEQQMAAIGRALMAEPRLLMMDEPSTGLAPLIEKEILATVRRLRDAGCTVLLVEQNARAALGIADRGYVLETGRIVLEGSAEELLHNNDVQRAYLGKEYRRIDEERR